MAHSLALVVAWHGRIARGVSRVVRLAVALVLPITSVGATSAPTDVPTRRVQVTRLDNLVYQLDCVARVIAACAYEDYRALWDELGLGTTAQPQQLTAWSTARQAVLRRVAGRRAPDPVRIAASRSVTADALVQQLGELADQTTATAMVRILSDIDSVWGPWFERVTAAFATREADELAALLHTPSVEREFGLARRFLDVTVDARDTLIVALHPRPGRARAVIRGEQLGTLVVVEAIAGEPAARRAEVVLHEWVHTLYARRSDAQQATLAARLYQSAAPGRDAAALLLDEGLASAFGNGRLARALTNADAWTARLRQPQAFYADPDIDAAARVWLPLLDDAIARRLVLNDAALLSDYRRQLAARLGARANAPRLLLREMFLFADSALGADVPMRIMMAVRPAALFATSGRIPLAPVPLLEERPQLTAMFVVRSDAVPALLARGVVPATLRDALTNAVAVPATRRPVVSGRRPSGAPVFVVVADTPDEVSVQIERLVREGDAAQDATQDATQDT